MSDGPDQSEDEKILKQVKKEAEDAGMGSSNKLSKDLGDRIREGQKRLKQGENGVTISSNNSRRK